MRIHLIIIKKLNDSIQSFFFFLTQRIFYTLSICIKCMIYYLYICIIYAYITFTTPIILLQNRCRCSTIIITMEMYITQQTDASQRPTRTELIIIHCATKIIAPSTRHMTSNHRISKGGFFYTIGVIYLFINIFFFHYIPIITWTLYKSSSLLACSRIYIYRVTYLFACTHL